jgi:hypothetical protein
MERLLFQEEQRFTQKWIWLLIVGASLFSIISALYGINSQEILEKSWENNPSSTKYLVAILLFEMLFMGGIILLFLKMRLQVEIKSDGIYFRFPPLARKWKSIVKDEIARYEVRTYQPVLEYGGWGIKGSTKNKAYNIKGNVGLQLYLKNEKKILIGTQQKKAIEYAMEKMMKNENPSKNG